jgi:hypothetical protein
MTLDLGGICAVILDTHQAAVDVLVKNGNDALQRSSISSASMTAYELIASKL